MVKRKKEDEVDSSDVLILEYLKKTNRPYSANDVFNNLHGKVGKTQLIKSLTALADRGDILAKAYGKQMVYVIKQDDKDKPSKEELDKMDNQIKELKEELAILGQETKELSGILNKLKSSLTAKEIEQKMRQLQQENVKSEERLKVLRAGSNLVSEDEKKLINKAYERNRSMWKARKKMCKEVLDVIMENATDNPKSVMTDMGIETDEDAGMNINIDPLKNL